MARQQGPGFAGSPTLTTKIAGSLKNVDRALLAPIAEVGHYLARTIRDRVTKEHTWLRGPASRYVALRGPEDPKRRVLVPPGSWHPGTEGYDYQVIRTGKYKDWAVYANMAAYRTAESKSKSERKIDYVQTGELWYRRLRVWVRGPTNVRVLFSGRHLGASKRSRRTMYARDLARIHVRRHPGSALSVTPEEMVGVRRIVRRRINAQVAEAIVGEQQKITALGKFASANRRLSKLLGD